MASSLCIISTNFVSYMVSAVYAIALIAQRCIIKLMNALVRRISMWLWLLTCVLFFVLPLWVIKFEDGTALGGQIMGSWVLDILVGIFAFLVFVATFISNKKNSSIVKKVSIFRRPINLPRTLLTILIITILGFAAIQNPKVLSFLLHPSPSPTPIPTIIEPTATTQPTRLVSPIIKATTNPTSSDTQKWGETVKLDEHTSVSKFAADDHMSTVEELNQAMNQYRITHNLPSLKFDSLLCNMAQTRADQLQANGKLDDHAGFKPLAENQQSFNTLDEVTFGGVNKVSGVHIVEWGWNTSLTGHKEAISDPRWKEGCGGVSGLFAVFIFGER